MNMKNMKSMHSVLTMASVMIVALFTSCQAQAQTQINNARTETVHVYGNCGMCKATIEKSAFKKDLASAEWDKSTKMAVITYDSTQTNKTEILQRIADGGYDNEMFTAPDKSYAKLPGCCQYDRKVE
jgi:hypothetical protein